MKTHEDPIISALDEAILQVGDHLNHLEEIRNRLAAEHRGLAMAREALSPYVEIEAAKLRL